MSSFHRVGKMKRGYAADGVLSTGSCHSKVYIVSLSSRTYRERYSFSYGVTVRSLTSASIGQISHARSYGKIFAR